MSDPSNMDEEHATNLLSRIGGPAALEAAVDIFYDRLVGDSNLTDFFEGVDADILKSHQRKFLTLAFTKVPDGLDVPKMLHEKHHRLFALGLNVTHFDRVLSHFSETLKALQIHDDIVDQALAVILPFRVVFVEGTKEHLLDKIGGPSALEAAVDIFYERMIVDETLTRFFEGIDVDTLKAHQRKFLTLALTKVPKNLDVPKYMFEKHERLFSLGLNEIHFDAVATHLVETLEGLQVHVEHIDAVVAIVTPFRSIFEDGAKRHAGLLPETPSLLERLGGESAVDAAVDEFYRRILDDDNLIKFFEGAPMSRLKQHQKRFLKIAFTKIPESLDVPKMMLDKHERLFALGLDGTHFDIVAGHLIGALDSLGVPMNLIDEAVAIVAPLRVVFEQGATAAKAKGI